MITELRIFLAESKIDTVYDGARYLNPLNYRFQVANEDHKRRMLQDMDEVLEKYSDEELDMMVNRKAKISLKQNADYKK